MKHLLILLAAACAAVLGCLAALALPVRADSAATLTAPAAPVAPAAAVAAGDIEVLPPTPPSVQPVDPNDDHAPANERLVEWTLVVMQGWTHAVAQVPASDYMSIAWDIASVSDSPREAAILAALAYWEGARFAEYVDAHLCNDPVWRATPEGKHLMHLGGDCDGGRAHSLWQIHPLSMSDSLLYPLCNAGTVDGPRVGAARCALALVRASLKATGDLRGYTGEWTYGHPKADERLKFAHRALEKHPFRP